MLDLSESRAQIDVIDKEITRLFQKRIDVCRDVAAYKIQNNKKVLDKTRENQKLCQSLQRMVLKNMASAICLRRSWQFAASVSIRS